MASSIVNSPRLSQPVIVHFSLKIKKEMKAISSDAHDSILRDNIEAVKHFSWQTVWLELTQKIPTLMSLLSHLIPKPDEHTSSLLSSFTNIKIKASTHGTSPESSFDYDVWQWYC